MTFSSLAIFLTIEYISSIDEYGKTPTTQPQEVHWINETEDVALIGVTFTISNFDFPQFGHFETAIILLIWILDLSSR